MLSLEIGVDDRLQTMKAVGVLHPVEVEVPAQHIIIHPLWFVLFFLSFSHLVCYFFLFPFFISSLAACPLFSAFVLLVPRLSLSPQSVLVLSFAEIFKSSIPPFPTILLSVPPPFFF